MKKKYVTGTGIIAAAILVAMFIGLSLSAYPFLIPNLSATTIDPVTSASIDENNMLVLTGGTTLPVSTYLSVTLLAVPGSYPENNRTGMTKGWDQGVIAPGDSGHNTWKAEFDVSHMQPADYRITVASYTLGNNYSIIESSPLITGRFTLGGENAGPDAVRIRSPVTPVFIRINPAPAGSQKINGITSFSSGTPFVWSLVTNGSLGYTGTVLVTNGTAGVNRWSVTPTAGTLSPGRYQFTIAGNSTTAGTISAMTQFDSTSQNAPGASSIPRDYITIDALPDFQINNVYIITGTTSLPVGEGLMMEVSPASFDTNYTFSANARDTAKNGTLSGTALWSGAMANTGVVSGNNGENLWSFQLPTYTFGPGTYQINVSNDRFDTTNMTMVHGTLLSSRLISITGDTP